MKRLLCIVSSMDRGGAETFLMKVYRSLDRSKYQMDFCVFKPKEGFYDAEIKKMGGKIFVLPPKSKNPFKTFWRILKLVKKEKYLSVLRTSQQSLATLDLLAAKLGGAKKLIYRSSNANITGGIMMRIINTIFSFLPKIIPNVKLAPSTESAVFVFGKRQVKNGKVTILPNGLDYNKFKFNEGVRDKIRKELHFNNNTIYGHIGRFNVQKNHSFLLDIFSEIYKKDPNARLILIGEGELEQEVKAKIKKLNLENVVLLLGVKENANEYYMAMDYMIFPSFFEGMPNVVIEAQAAGLKCTLSDTITKEADLTGLLTYMGINNSSKEWANQILNNLDYKRKSYEKEFLNKGYIISKNIQIYINKFF